MNKLIQTPLTIEEATRLGRCEGVIKKGLNTFVEVGEALMVIRDSRLYRSEFGTFEAYCSERWGMVQQSATRMIRAAEVVRNIQSEPIGSLPMSESQARPLSSLPPEAQQEVWQDVVSRHGENITAAKVAEVVSEYQGAKKAHVSNNTGNPEWYTPAKFVNSARLVMGGIDLDPASCEMANETVEASNIYTAETNGINNPWFGRVWLNPPYSQPEMTNFAERLSLALESNEIEQAIVLTNNATETGWFAIISKGANAYCFPRKRIRFNTPATNDTATGLQGQCFTYFGNNVAAFAEEFSRYGKILLPYE